MKLNPNSITARLYKWFYHKSILPTNLCPYFWQLVLMWVLIIPVTLLSAPVLIFDKTFNLKVRNNDSLNESYFVFRQTIIGVLTYMSIAMLIVILTPFSLFFIELPEKGTFLYNIISAGITILISLIVITICFGVLYLSDYIKEKRRERKYHQLYNKPKPDNIIKEFIKAKYNKYCPKIDWE